jgi:hypothetical protein
LSKKAKETLPCILDQLWHTPVVPGPQQQEMKIN